jgi:hypothetical protein
MRSGPGVYCAYSSCDDYGFGDVIGVGLDGCRDGEGILAGRWTVGEVVKGTDS